MIRAVGAAEFGIIVYLNAVLGILMIGVDMGVPSAAGKSLAETRVRQPEMMRDCLLRWIRFQLVVSTVGLVPLMAIGSYIIFETGAISTSPIVWLTVVLAGWLAIAAAFVRSCLRSYLAFGFLAALDSIESLVRTASWLLISWLLPNSTGLALATLITSLMVSFAGASLLIGAAASQTKPPETSGVVDDRWHENTRYTLMLLDSLSFLGLSLTTRIFQSAPLFIFGHVLGESIVGVVGAFAKLLEIVSFPFITLGNALAVKAQEVRDRGIKATILLWHACFRFVVLGSIVTASVYLIADSLALMLLPKDPAAGKMFGVLSLSILAYTTSCFFPTMSDYVGGLRRRVLFLACLSLLQVPLLWYCAVRFGDIASLQSYVAIQFVMIFGYMFIAKTAFFQGIRYVPPKDVFLALALVLIALLLTENIPSVWSAKLLDSAIHNSALCNILIFFIFNLLAFTLIEPLRRRYLSLSLFHYD